MTYHFCSAALICMVLVILFLFTSCRLQRIKRERQLVRHTEADSGFSRSMYEHSLLRSEAGDSTIAEVLVVPEEVFQYNTRDGYTGKAALVRIRYKQQQKRVRTDSVVYFEAEGESNSRTGTNASWPWVLFILVLVLLAGLGYRLKRYSRLS